MRLTTIPRLVAGIATLAVATSVLAMPASAKTPDRFDVDRSFLTTFAEIHAAGQYTAADLETEDGIDVFEDLADDACAEVGPTPNSDLLQFDFVDSGVGPAVFVVSADVNADDDLSTWENTCTFAVLLTDEGTTMNGSLTLTVDEETPISGTFSGDFIGVGPVVVPISDFYTNGTFSASGNQLIPSQHVVKRKVSTPKTKKQKKAAKKKYSKAVKKAKKAYKKAGKTKKAKKKMNRAIAKAKKAYKKSTATYKYVNRLENYTATKRFSLNTTLDSADAVR